MSREPLLAGEPPCPHCGAGAEEFCVETDDEPLVGWGWHQARWELHQANLALVKFAESQGLVGTQTWVMDNWDCPDCDHKEAVTTKGPDWAKVQELANLPRPCKVCGAAMVKST